MRVLCGCVLALSLAGSAEGLTSMRHHSHSHSRLHSHISSHETVSADPAPCGAGYVRVFQPQLGCAQLSAPKEAVDLVVVTESTCKDVLQGIRTKTAPYWDLEMNRCADESRKGLLTQCATKIGSNFSTSLQVCANLENAPPLPVFHDDDQYANSVHTDMLTVSCAPSSHSMFVRRRLFATLTRKFWTQLSTNPRSYHRFHRLKSQPGPLCQASLCRSELPCQ